jgi:hypothetical protein
VVTGCIIAAKGANGKRGGGPWAGLGELTIWQEPAPSRGLVLQEWGETLDGRQQGILTIEADCDKLDKSFGEIQGRIGQIEELVDAF